MLENLVKSKESLTVVTEDTTLSEALMIIEDFNYRALPILDQSGQLFRGVIYKLHLYKHKANNGDMQQPVTSVMRNTTKFINLDDSFYDLTFALRDLPFISVLDHENHFAGIITHNRYMHLLEDSWFPTTASTVLTIATSGERGSLERVSRIIARYTTVLSLLTLNPDNDLSTARIVATIPAEVNEATIGKISRTLVRKGFALENIEKVHHN